MKKMIVGGLAAGAVAGVAPRKPNRRSEMKYLITAAAAQAFDLYTRREFPERTS